MKKSLTFAGLLFLVGTLCFAELAANRFEIARSEEEFDLAYFVPDEMSVLKKTDSEDVFVNQAFKFKRGKIKGELRYSLFKDLGGDPATLNYFYSLCVYMYLRNATGYDISLSNCQSYPDDSVKEEFNADFGSTIMISNPKSNFAKGYSMVAFDFFYKEGQGIVIRSFLFNDLKFLGYNESDGSMTQDCMYHDYFHSFRFMDKDENGNYIEPQFQ